MEDGSPDPQHMTAFGSYIYFHTWLVLVMIAPTIATLCFLSSLKNKYPVNYFLLLVFTTFASCNLGAICVLYYR